MDSKEDKDKLAARIDAVMKNEAITKLIEDYSGIKSEPELASSQDDTARYKANLKRNLPALAAMAARLDNSDGSVEDKQRNLEAAIKSEDDKVIEFDFSLYFKNK